jgi:hypothetical protein
MTGRAKISARCMAYGRLERAAGDATAFRALNANASRRPCATPLRHGEIFALPARFIMCHLFRLRPDHLDELQASQQSTV